MEIQSVIELESAKRIIDRLEKEKEVRELTDEEFLRVEQLKDDVEYFEEFIL